MGADRTLKGDEDFELVHHAKPGSKPDVLIGVTIKVIYGDPESVPDVVGAHTAYVERTNLTSRQMNGRLVRKTLSYSKQLEALRASCAWEDWVVGLHTSAQDARGSGA